MIDPTAKIHPTAVIEGNVKIGANTTVGPFTYISGDVEIGEDNEIMSHVVIKGLTKIGNGNRVFSFAILGEENQDKKYQGEATQLIVGDRNVIRESVQMHRGTIQDKGITQVGSDNLFCVNAHIAHDCVIGDNVILGNNATLAGHVKVQDYVILTALVPVHQFCTLGAHAFVGGGSTVAQDIPPFVMAQGNHCSPIGINSEGMKRRGFEKQDILAVRRAFKTLYRSGLTLDEAKEEIAKSAEEYPAVKQFMDYLNNDVNRGIIR
ncbi:MULTISPECIES: acyl-ACP--UDP-N-acetylglucosamine O-acyltransferase [Vibrio]|uniref:Acyl-[acyl-carrier-protein]--UDP-N-acetylglucosamine O-acyltransferase n=1 Tax=Vibrio superstes NBRC 103154 TaxID=1219062 RepID=A0A511QMW5_9VIBR|nr:MULTISPECIES: acyl-ACP--UDP-N-acetylglucosamine O-acyltransferase [Vibrio]MDN3716213.1 acyl-ACP--UDP-N-acetylglucosamine O-acyltransferase [Vibrio breoganii]GEM78661.1 acyl-[acyl-carrier-protein]--UDP-N-acetylglucosamine O-acyltransferase [Vibrio superstes NBRC 103154]